MSLISEFVAKVLSEDGSFLLENPDKNSEWCWFMQGKVGKAKFVYGSYGYDEFFHMNVGIKPELIAIVAGGKVYVINRFFLGVWEAAPENTRKFPDDAGDFYEYIRNLNQRTNDILFPAFYKDLEKVELEDISECRKKARDAMLSLDLERYVAAPRPTEGFGAEDTLKILCGGLDSDEEAINRLEKDRDWWCLEKAKHEMLMEMIAEGDGAEPWEREMAMGLRSFEYAAYVTVEFSMDGKYASGKVRPDKVEDKLKKRDRFCEWDFETSKQGMKIYEELGATDSLSGERPLKCEHISKISYRKKILYQRKAV